MLNIFKKRSPYNRPAFKLAQQVVDSKTGAIGRVTAVFQQIGSGDNYVYEVAFPTNKKWIQALKLFYVNELDEADEWT